MGDTQTTSHRIDGGDDEVRGMSKPQLEEMIERVAEEAIRTKHGLLAEEHARRAVDQVFQRHIERLIVREGLLEQQMNALVPRDPRLLDQQRQLEQLARSLLGPQDLLERAPALNNPDPTTGPIARPIFDQPQADWSLPRIPPPGLDQPPPPPYLDQPGQVD